MNGRIFVILISVALASCGAKNSFNQYAVAGDTVALPVGMQPDFNKDNITLTITDANNIVTVFAPGATGSGIRGIINLYPDPVSNMLVSRAIGSDLTNFAQLYADRVKDSASNDKDWFQTTVFLNLPTTLPLGTTQIEVKNGLGAIHTVALEIIENSAGTGGQSHKFLMDIDEGISMSTDMFDSMARANHTIIRLKKTSASVPVPHAVELTLSHDPDETVAGGAGKAFVINPLGYLKDLSWNDDGTNIKIIMMVNEGGNTLVMKDFKFYVAGTTTNLASGAVKGFDVNGNEISGYTLELTSTPSI